MFQKQSTSFSILNPSNLNMPRMTVPSQPMAKKLNTLRQNLIYLTLTYLGYNNSNPLQAPFCTIPKQLIPLYYRP